MQPPDTGFILFKSKDFRELSAIELRIKGKSSNGLQLFFG